MISAPDDTARAILSEYHAVGSVSAAYMLRKGRYKFHYYVGFPPELFDLENDPEETVNLADESSYEAVLKDMEHALREFLDPEKVDAQAKTDQADLVTRFGGREKAIHAGTGGATPVPGQNPE